MRDSCSPDGEIGLESATGLVVGLEVLRLEGVRWVGQDFGGFPGPPSHGILSDQLGWIPSHYNIVNDVLIQITGENGGEDNNSRRVYI